MPTVSYNIADGYVSFSGGVYDEPQFPDGYITSPFLPAGAKGAGPQDAFGLYPWTGWYCVNGNDYYYPASGSATASVNLFNAYGWSSPQSFPVSTGASTIPVPQGLTAVGATSSSVTLTWTETPWTEPPWPGAAIVWGYLITASAPGQGVLETIDNGDGASPIGPFPTSVTYSVFGLSPDTIYTFTVAAVGRGSNWNYTPWLSPDSQPISAATLPASPGLKAPSGLIAKFENGNQVELQWTGEI
jgi:hypothetical protein